VLTTPRQDREGHVVVPSGVRLEWFRKNPVVLWAHCLDLPPIGVVDVKTLAVTDAGIEADVVFDKGSAVGREVYGLYDRGVMRAWSVGFVPINWEIQKNSETGKVRGYRVTEWELVELSAVPVPANPEALSRTIEHYESHGYDPTLDPVVKTLKAILSHGPDTSLQSPADAAQQAEDRSGADSPSPRTGAEPAAAKACPERPAGNHPVPALSVKELSHAFMQGLAGRIPRLVARELHRMRGGV